MLLLLLLLPQPQPPCHHWLTAHHCHSIPCLQLLACAIPPAFPGCCACSWRVLRYHTPPVDAPAEPSAGLESALASQPVTTSPPPPPTDVTTTTAASTGWDEGNWSDDDDAGADWGLGTPPAATAEADVDVDALMARRDALLAARSKPVVSSSASHGKSAACQQAGTPALAGTDAAATSAAAASAATGATAAAAPSMNDSGGTPAATDALAHSSFPSFVLAVDAEPYEAASASAAKADTSYELRLLAEYRQWEQEQHGAQGEGEAAAGSIGSGATGGGAAADSASDDEDESPATIALKAYERRLARLPSQCLRYAYGGHPLWATTRPPKLSPPPCPCGAARVFEMQVSLPALCWLARFVLVERFILTPDLRFAAVLYSCAADAGSALSIGRGLPHSDSQT